MKMSLLWGTVRRRVWNTITVLSLVLFLAVVAIWTTRLLRSPSKDLRVAFEITPRLHCSVYAFRHMFSFGSESELPAPEMSPPVPRDGNTTRAMAAWRDRVRTVKFVGGGFAYVRVALLSNGSDADSLRLYAWMYRIDIPYYAVLVLFALPPIVWSVSYWRRRRIAYRVSKGLCQECGYDLRASKERCPECGTAISAERVAEVETEKRDM